MLFWLANKPIDKTINAVQHLDTTIHQQSYNVIQHMDQVDLQCCIAGDFQYFARFLIIWT